MDLKSATERAFDIRQKFAKLEHTRYGRSWSREEIAMGFIGDVGDLMKLLQAEEGIRDIVDHREKLAHELADCLWSILVLARLCDIDIEKAFSTTMDDLDQVIVDLLGE